jgi:hypothetical protein
MLLRSGTTVMCVCVYTSYHIIHVMCVYIYHIIHVCVCVYISYHTCVCVYIYHIIHVCMCVYISYHTCVCVYIYHIIHVMCVCIYIISYMWCVCVYISYHTCDVCVYIYHIIHVMCVCIYIISYMIHYTSYQKYQILRDARQMRHHCEKGRSSCHHVSQCTMLVMPWYMIYGSHRHASDAMMCESLWHGACCMMRVMGCDIRVMPLLASDAIMSESLWHAAWCSWCSEIWESLTCCMMHNASHVVRYHTRLPKR